MLYKTEIIMIGMIKIKYRVWDKVHKRLRRVSSIDFLNQTVTYQFEGIGITIKFNDCILMKCIGQDKTNKDVYEYDKLTRDKYPFKEDGKTIYIGIVDWVEEENSYYLTKKLVDSERRGISDGISEPLGDLEFFEVVGNVFEEDEFKLVIK